MSLDNIVYLNNHVLLKQFLHENPRFYKILNRNPESIYQLEKLMKEKYKLTLPDKIDKVKDKLELLNTFIDILN